MSVATPPRTGNEATLAFPCFGGSCSVRVSGPGAGGSAAEAALRTRWRFQQWHRQLSRFSPASELSRLNRDPRATVPVSATMVRFVGAALYAARLTGGLVDPTLVEQIERAGYAHDLRSDPLPVDELLRLAPARRPAGPDPAAGWSQITVDRRARTVTRPPGVRLDSGGVAKGLFCDLLAPILDFHSSYAVAAAGEVRWGGSGGVARPVHVASPFDGSVLHTFELSAGAVATSGISSRSWLGSDGRPAHHLLDPSSGYAAFTGVVQATALAPTAVEAEALSKAALLSGPRRAAGWLTGGGLIVLEDGSLQIIAPATRHLAR